jgi:hypothetical protein
MDVMEIYLFVTDAFATKVSQKFIFHATVRKEEVVNPKSYAFCQPRSFLLIFFSSSVNFLIEKYPIS